MNAMIPPAPAEMPPPLALALAASFGSVERWRDALAAELQARGGGAGRVLLLFRERDGRLVHHPVPHRGDAAVPDGSVPIFELDVERQRAGGQPAGRLVDDVDWSAVAAAYRGAVEAASDRWGADAGDVGEDTVVIDVRRRGVYEAATAVLPRASWCDPAATDRWAVDLPTGRAVVVYCVHGHEVSRGVALRLRGAGIDARFLRGGIEGWQAGGREVRPRPPSAC